MKSSDFMCRSHTCVPSANKAIVCGLSSFIDVVVLNSTCLKNWLSTNQAQRRQSSEWGGGLPGRLPCSQVGVVCKMILHKICLLKDTKDCSKFTICHLLPSSTSCATFSFSSFSHLFSLLASHNADCSAMLLRRIQ